MTGEVDNIYINTIIFLSLILCILIFELSRQNVNQIKVFWIHQLNVLKISFRPTIRGRGRVKSIMVCSNGWSNWNNLFLGTSKIMIISIRASEKYPTYNPTVIISLK